MILVGIYWRFIHWSAGVFTSYPAANKKSRVLMSNNILDRQRPGWSMTYSQANRHLSVKSAPSNALASPLSILLAAPGDRQYRTLPRPREE